MNRVIVPTNNAYETENLENLVAEITADDTPSRHPCKIRISPWRGKGHRFDPYQAKVISSCSLALQGLEDPDEDTSDEELVEASHTDAFVEAAAEAAEQGLIQYTPYPNTAATSTYYSNYYGTPSPQVAPSMDQQPGLTPEPYFPEQPQQPVATPKTTPVATNTPRNLPWMQTSPQTGLSTSFTHNSGTTSPVPFTASSSASYEPTVVHNNNYNAYVPQQQPQQLQLSSEPAVTTTTRGYHTYTTSHPRPVDGVSPPITPQMGSKSGSFASSETNSHVRPRGNSVASSSKQTRGIKYGVIVFKHLKDKFFIPSTERDGLQVGDFVVVEGDRGENVGQLVEDITPTHHRNDPIAGRIVRKATHADRRLWETARRREVEATALCQAFAEDFEVEMKVNDTEFQTDLNKLTIYYNTFDGAPVDFRQMQRALFKHYRCRIWLVDQTNTPLS